MAQPGLDARVAPVHASTVHAVRRTPMEPNESNRGLLGASRRSGVDQRPWRSRVFWAQIGSTTLVLGLTALLIAALVDRWVRSDLWEAMENQLRREAELVAPTARLALREGVVGARQELLGELSAATGLRLTWIAANGEVIGDSHEAPERMDDHGLRPEVIGARTSATGLGVATRRSATVELELLYVAKALRGDEGELEGYARVSLPTTEVRQRAARVRRSVWLGAGLGLLLSVAVGTWLARRRAAPIAALTRVAEDMRAGIYTSRASVQRRDEIGILAATLNRLGHELTQRIARISREDAQLRAMVSGMVEGVVAIDAEDQLMFVNEAARSLLGLPAFEDLGGRKLWQVAPVAALEDLLGRARNANALSRGELSLLRGGVERIIDAQATPFRGGGSSGIVAVLHDVTDLRRLENVRRDFVANVSHELKTPLTTIKGFVETLLDGALHDEENNERFLRRIDANVDRLASLVSDLLSLARIESTQGQVQREPVDWGQLLRELLPRHEDVARRKGIELVAPDADAAVAVLGDREALTQVADNLIDNAIKYTPAPGTVRIELARGASTGVLRVQDTGVGIPADDIGRVFERFYRVDKARSREVGGTGLGLSIVKNLVMALGGEVKVHSQPGEGARFDVELPLA